jgi:hypothetical protein
VLCRVIQHQLGNVPIALVKNCFCHRVFTSIIGGSVA